VRKVVLLLLAFAVASFSLAASKTVSFAVKGWTCGSCAASTRIALKKLDGVEEVKTNPQKMEATVTYDDGKVTPEKMIQTIERLGYKATIKAGGASGVSSPGSARRPAGNVSGPPERVSFFEVPLACSAAEGLGCGSAAKPILKELGENSRIADARINYAGTVLAVVWKDPAIRSDSAVEALFDKHHLAAATLRGEARDKALEEFRPDQWYGAADVDRLSEHEARVIAARIVNRARPRLGLPPDRLAALTEELAVVFARHMTARDFEYDTEREVIERELVRAASKYLNAQRLAELRKAGEQGVLALPGEAK